MRDTQDRERLDGWTLRWLRDQPHSFGRGGGCMSRCWCGRTFSDPVHGEQPENIRQIREVVLMETSIVHTDAPPGEMDRHGAWALKRGDPDA